MNTEDRIKGAFIGLYFGAGVNPRFSPILSSEEARKRFSDKAFGDYEDYKIYGPRYKLYDQHTMTKIVFDMLLKYGEITPDLFKDYLLELHKEYDVFKGYVYGPSTQNAVKKLLAGENPYEMGKKGITCGSAMRALPVGMLFHNDSKALYENTVGASIISHNTDVAIDAALICNVTLASLINGKSKYEAIAEGIHITEAQHGKAGELTDEPSITELVRKAVDALKGKTIDDGMRYIPEQLGVSWYARDTIPGAFANYIVSNTPQDSSLLSMRCGGDNQTVPEIACAFLGAEQGPDIFPPIIIKKIEAVNKINIYDMAEALVKKLPR